MYNDGQRIGTCFLNYVNKVDGYGGRRRSMRLHLQVKERGSWSRTIDQFTVIIPLDLLKRMMAKVAKDGPITYQRAFTFKRLLFKERRNHAPMAEQKNR